MGNRAISERLFVSLRTVENHLQGIHDKLDVAGRQELTAALGRDMPADPTMSTPDS